MFRKLLDFLGLSKKPAVNLPCSPCEESCERPEDCFKAEPVSVPPELVEPAIVAEFYKQDVAPTNVTTLGVPDSVPLPPLESDPTPAVLAPVAEKKLPKVKKPAVEKKPAAKKPAEKKTKGATTKPATAMTAPKKKTTKKK